MQVEYNGMMISPNEKTALEYLKAVDYSQGITPEEVRHLYDGEILAARRALHTLAKKKLLKKRITKRLRSWGGARGLVKVAIFYPRD